MKKHVIIGTSAAALSTANTLRNLDPAAQIIMISDEHENPYNKCRLADYCSGALPPEQVHTLSPEAAVIKNITLMLGTKVVEIAPHPKCVYTDKSQQIHYDTLFIGTGSSPYIPPLFAQDVGGIFPFHSLNNIQAIDTYILTKHVRNVVVIGSGLTGLEAADSMKARGLTVSIVEMNNHVLPSHVTQAGSEYIHRSLKEHAVFLYTQDSVVNFIHPNQHVQAVRLASGKEVLADMIIIASGVRPNVTLAKQAGIALAGSGILVNDTMQTSHESIYAGGDVVMVKDQLTGMLVQSCMWPDAMLQGIVAAHAMVGKHRIYPGVTLIASSSFFGIKFASCGLIKHSGDASIIEHRTSDFHHTYILEGDHLKGFSLIGNVGNLGALKRAVLTRQPVTQELLLGGF